MALNCSKIQGHHQHLFTCLDLFIRSLSSLCSPQPSQVIRGGETWSIPFGGGGKIPSSTLGLFLVFSPGTMGGNEPDGWIWSLDISARLSSFWNFPIRRLIRNTVSSELHWGLSMQIGPSLSSQIGARCLQQLGKTSSIPGGRHGRMCGRRHLLVKALKNKWAHGNMSHPAAATAAAAVVRGRVGVDLWPPRKGKLRLTLCSSWSGAFL